MDKTVVGPDLLGGDHLPPERLAALADEPATVVEARHLASCDLCADEVEAYRALLALTRGERDRLGEPLTTWDTLSTALLRDKLVGNAPRPTLAGRPGGTPWRRLRPVGQAAAAAALLASGIAIGRLSASHAAPSVAAPSVAAPSVAPPSVAAMTPPTAAGTASLAAVKSDSKEPLERMISDTTSFASRSQALDALARAEGRYRHAVAYLMETDGTAPSEGPDGYRTRLAALKQVEQATRAALVEAPNDPVLNQWYISTVGAQQATLQQLQQARPVNQGAHRY
jgi:hypothetical protein